MYFLILQFNQLNNPSLVSLKHSYTCVQWRCKKQLTYKYYIGPLISFVVILIFTNNEEGIYLWSRSTMVY